MCEFEGGIQLRGATKMNPVMGGLGCKGIMAALTAKSKLPDVQAPQPRRTIPNSQPLESQTDHQ
jgi:hypothetical protein